MKSYAKHFPKVPNFDEYFRQAEGFVSPYYKKMTNEKTKKSYLRTC